MDPVVDGLLARARQMMASDVHLKVGVPPILRVKGELQRLADMPAVNQEGLDNFALGIMNPRQRAIFEERREVDLAYSTSDGIRYRVSVFQQRGATGMVLRVIPAMVPPFQTLNLPEVVLKLAGQLRGLVLVTGITGSGKSTTLAAMVDQISRSRTCHILTIEDPIEFVFKDSTRTSEIREAISTGREPYGMISFDQSLTELVQTGLITYGEALKNATNADDFALRYRGIGEGSQSEVELVPKGQFTEGKVPMEGMNIELDDGKDRRF